MTEEVLCPCCFTMSTTVEWRRRNTAYLDDKLNWLFSCEECILEEDAYYDELWQDYYSSRL